MKPRVYIETFGCQMNVADSERAATGLRASGYELCESADDADVHSELLGPPLPRAVGGERWTRQAPGERQTHPVAEAQVRAMPVERGGEPRVQASERANGHVESLQSGVDVLSGHAVLGGLLDDLCVVHRAERGAFRGGRSCHDFPAGLPVQEREQR